jgi:hypothetical protein
MQRLRREAVEAIIGLLARHAGAASSGAYSPGSWAAMLRNGA